jgi:hypothetical protein
MSRRPFELADVTEDVAGDLVALLLLGVVFGLGMLGAVEALAYLGGRYQAELDRPRHRGAPIRNIEFAQDAMDAHRGRAHGPIPLLGDLVGAQTLGDETQDLELPRIERMRALAHTLLTAACLDHWARLVTPLVVSCNR